MKLADLNAFCWRQWEDSGTVESMTLPAADLRELAEEMLADASAVMILSSGMPGTPVAGARVDSFVNPASKTVVKLDLAAPDEAATAVVRHGPDGSLTRTVAVA